MVGDRLLTDVAMSRELAITSVLVLSGATTEADLASTTNLPDYVIPGIGDLLPGPHPLALSLREPP
jgi:ribonucleotide monophosphatase NagD (HAD superfamily)